MPRAYDVEGAYERRLQNVLNIRTFANQQPNVLCIATYKQYKKLTRR